MNKENLKKIWGNIKSYVDNGDNKANTNITNLNANTGIDEYEEFNDKKEYKAGTTVLKDGLLKTFIKDHAAGAWDDEEVEDGSLKKEVEKINTKFGTIINYVYGYYSSSVDGILNYSANRCTTGYIYNLKKLEINDGYEILGIISFDLTCNFLKKITDLSEINSDMLVRINIRKTDDSNFNGNENPIKSVKVISANILEGKKWAVCGDSFSNGDFTGSTEDNTISDGLYAGKNKVYGYLIGNRNNMIIQHMALGGRTLATPSDLSFTNAFSYIENQTENSNYTQIAEDADYATFYFGINDSHHRQGSTSSDGEDQTGIIEIGTIDDNTNTTFYGAWNVMLEWLVNNRPFTKLGIIVSNGCETDDYRLATINIAKKWGVPYIDLNGDERTPIMLRSTNPDIVSSVKTAKLNAQRVAEGNNHPNAKAHEYESTFIENFLRSL